MSAAHQIPTPSTRGCAAAVLEIERHAAAAGWDQPARLFALVETARAASSVSRSSPTAWATGC